MTMRRALLAVLLAATFAGAASAAQAAPAIDVSCNGMADCGNWFASPVTLRWSVTNGTRSAGCVDETVADEGTDVARSCQAEGGGLTSTLVAHLKIDLTPPTVSAITPARPPDANGWYTRPLSFAVDGQDTTSGLAGCDQPAYAGPDSAAASIVATCRDVAGNTAARSFPFQYDATPPDLGALAAETGDRLVQLSWPAAATARVERTPGLGGAGHSSLRAQPDGLNDLRVRNDVRYRYAVTVADQAGNTTTREITAVPGPRLLAPASRAQLTGPPMLRWTPVRGARYYNVQLFREGHKILSAWPRRAHFQLERRWRFKGAKRKLADGDYRWLVWPGEGARADRRYGERIGARRFTIDR